ncbi:SprT family protein [Lederbergia wuyishanensis]|uniref:Protein SprT-like n=1 Tax=Lederbergia wuyishanensis TaxID=1347903 RepID=A0ABU0DA27_9BACI|nr:SprT family protein [Lederbergia wuyishanensis]MCJ8008519.1 SprT family protein [Lederbergia wuyishanensis]MDQ0345261.1 SprT-like protein [Lederbergia wuyishanensis]
MTNEELQILTQDISTRFFLKPFKHMAYFNPRLRTTGGRYMLSTHHIEINRQYYEEHGFDELVGIIKHELCHYHLHIEGKGYKHRDKDFRELMQKVGAPRHCTPLKKSIERKSPLKVYFYKCINCGQGYQRQRRVNTRRFVCGKCGGKLEGFMRKAGFF